MPHSFCTCCQAQLQPGLADWHLICPACAYEGANLTPTINSENNVVKPDEVEREAGLKTLRQRNFAKIIESINAYCEVARPRLLDVGCAHGLFLELLDDRFEAVGVEPHTPVAQHTRAKGLNVREGYFPQVLSPDEDFDIIIFNDVLEHIPDLPQVIKACYDSLSENGILILNLPNSSGILYRVSRVMARTGLTGMFERMWQIHYPSPHLHYFNTKNLTTLIEAHSFKRLHVDRLDTLSGDGLYHRISHTGEYSFPVALLMYVAAWLAIPVLKLLPADIQLQIFRKKRRQ